MHPWMSSSRSGVIATSFLLAPRVPPRFATSSTGLLNATVTASDPRLKASTTPFKRQSDKRVRRSVCNMAEPLPRIQQASLLDVLARDLDIPPGKYREAVSRYEAVGRWLDAPDSPLHSFSPQIYPQGSFRLGTVVRPVN